MSDWVKVTTVAQLFYHLERGEVVGWRFEGGEAFLRYLPGEGYRVVLQPKFGAGEEFQVGDRCKVAALFEDLAARGVAFWVCPGAGLGERGVPWWERLLGRIWRVLYR